MSATLTIWRLDTEDGFPMGYSEWTVKESFAAAIEAFPDAPNQNDPSAWEYVQVVSAVNIIQYYCGNDGAQGWRHIETGYTIPDYCRQTGGCPEIWTRENALQQANIVISNDSPILDFLVE